MKKATMQALVNYLAEKNDDYMLDVKAELEAELNRNAEKAAANREAYAAARDAILEVLRANPDVEMTAAELVLIDQLHGIGGLHFGIPGCLLRKDPSQIFHFHSAPFLICGQYITSGAGDTRHGWNFLSCNWPIGACAGGSGRVE